MPRKKYLQAPTWNLKIYAPTINVCIDWNVGNARGVQKIELNLSWDMRGNALRIYAEVN